MPDQEFKILITSTADNTGFEKAASGAGELTKAQAGVVEVTEKDIQKMEEGKTETDKFEVSKRELKETLRQLGPQFAILGEVAGLAFNPFTLAVGGLLLGLKSLAEVSAMVTENLSQVEMPDFDLEKVSEATRAWTGMADAIAKAHEASTGAEAQYKKIVDGLKQQLEITKELNKEQKTKALADLEAHKDTMSQEDYTASKKAIEDSYAGEDKEAEGKESAAELQAKYAEQANLQITADQKKKQAEAIPLPENDKDVEAQINAQKERLAKLKEESKKRQENIEFIGKVSTNSLSEGAEAFADRAKFRMTYGMGANSDDTTKQEQAAKNAADDSAKGVEADIERRQKMLEDRKKLRGEASEAAGKAETIKNELPGDAAANNTKQVIDTLNTHGGRTNQALGDLATQIGIGEQQKLKIVQRILDHSLTSAQAFAGLEQRLALLEAQSQNTASNRF